MAKSSQRFCVLFKFYSHNYNQFLILLTYSFAVSYNNLIKQKNVNNCK